MLTKALAQGLLLVVFEIFDFCDLHIMFYWGEPERAHATLAGLHCTRVCYLCLLVTIYHKI